jgi:hypothetical protein
MKLTKYPSNYPAWATAFITAINASVALNLKKEHPLDLDHFLDGIDQDLLVFALAGEVTMPSSDASGGGSMKLSGDEGKGVPSVSGDKDQIAIEPSLDPVTRKLDLVKLPAIMAHPQGNALVDRLKFMVFEKMGRERSEKEKIIALLIDSLSDDSLESIRSDKLCDQLIESSDLRGLWALVKKVHVLKDGSHVFRMEENLGSLHMGNLSLDEHLRVFRLQHDVGCGVDDG